MALRIRDLAIPEAAEHEEPARSQGLLDGASSCVGNLVGSYNDLAELMTLEAERKVKLHTCSYQLEAVNDAMDNPSIRAGCTGGAF